VYAVGATLYQMLTGQMPPEAPDRLYQDTLKPPAACGANLPPAAERALFKALAVRLEQRFQSVAELQAALVQAAEGQTIESPATMGVPSPPKAPKPATPQPDGQKSSFEKKWILAAVGMGVVGVLLLVQTLFKSPTPSASTTPQYTPTQAPPPVAQTQKPLIGGRYRDHGDGTVTDVQTRRQWMRCSLGQTWQGSTCIGEAKGYTWQAALDAASTLNRQGGYGGYRDWRVPTIEELRTLVYCSSGQPKTWNDKGKPCEGDYERPTIYQPAFPNTPRERFWSSTPYASQADRAWFVDFHVGNDYTNNYSFNDPVRFVRGGQ
jgi:hypothetical protein